MTVDLERSLRTDMRRRARTGSEFDAFAASQADSLVRAAFLMTGDRAEAEELAQECLLRLARRWPRVRGMQHRGAYAQRVLFNLILDGRRKRVRRNEELRNVEHTAQTVASGSSAPEERLDLIEALLSLPERQRAVLTLRYFADLSEEEIAGTLECAAGTVKSAAARGLARLSEVMGSAYGHGGETQDTTQGAQR